MELVDRMLSKGSVFMHFRFEDDTDVYFTSINGVEEWDIDNFGNKPDEYYFKKAKEYFNK